MRFKLLKIIIAIAGTAIAYQCSVALKMPTAIDAQKSGVSLDTLKMGRKMYVENCGSCHSLYLPEKYTAPQWAKNVEEMKVRSKLNDQQSAIIISYLTSNCKVEDD